MIREGKRRRWIGAKSKMANDIEKIKELRNETGAGIMACKNALIANGWDITKAKATIAEKGAAKLAERAERETKENISDVRVLGECAIIYQIGCETDFVSASDRFRKLVSDVGDALADSKPDNLEKAVSITKSLFSDAGVAIGEKLELKKYAIIRKTDPKQEFASYIHMKGKAATLVLYSGGDADIAQKIAMHITSENPEYISVDSISQTAKDTAFKEALSEKYDGNGRELPASMIETIAESKAKKRLTRKTLSEQPYLFDQRETVGYAMAKAGMTVLDFARV